MSIDVRGVGRRGWGGGGVRGLRGFRGGLTFEASGGGGYMTLPPPSDIYDSN